MATRRQLGRSPSLHRYESNGASYSHNSYATNGYTATSSRPVESTLSKSSTLNSLSRSNALPLKPSLPSNASNGHYQASRSRQPATYQSPVTMSPYNGLRRNQSTAELSADFKSNLILHDVGTRVPLISTYNHTAQEHQPNRYGDRNPEPRLDHGIYSNESVSNGRERTPPKQSSFEKTFHRTYRSRGRVGLQNLGNTCFMNSILQCLSNTEPLLIYTLSGQLRHDISGRSSKSKKAVRVAESFCGLIEAMWSESSGAITPKDFKQKFAGCAPNFGGGGGLGLQHDSQEFLRILMQCMQDAVTRVDKRPKLVPIDDAKVSKLSEKEQATVYWQQYLKLENSMMVDTFVGQLRSTLRCQKCGHESLTFDPFWDLSLPLPRARDKSLNDCIASFMSEETLEGQERPKCERCRDRQASTKRFSIQRFPKILVLHLKRFSQGSYRKIQDYVDFPARGLNLGRFSDSGRSHLYDLYGISNHIGGLTSGHYTAYARNPCNDQWYLFDDSRPPQVCDEATVVTSSAYVLFYVQQD